MEGKVPRLDLDTVAELVRYLEERLAGCDARTGRCALCRDAEAVAFLSRMKAWLERQAGRARALRR